MFVERYNHIDIYKCDDGYYASHGVANHFGYTDTLQELRDEIDDYWSGDEHGELNGIFDSSVSADELAWSQR